jgi:hypothetical protein
MCGGFHLGSTVSTCYLVLYAVAGAKLRMLCPGADALLCSGAEQNYLFLYCYIQVEWLVVELLQ